MSNASYPNPWRTAKAKAATLSTDPAALKAHLDEVWAEVAHTLHRLTCEGNKTALTEECVKLKSVKSRIRGLTLMEKLADLTYEKKRLVARIDEIFEEAQEVVDEIEGLAARESLAE